MHVYCPLFLLCLGRDMWNYLDVIVEIIYVFIVILRITTIARGGIPYNNRLLEISNYLYGINTLLMVLRVSSILELSPTIGPLQLALYRMCGDLLIILSQYCFVILGFSMAITKSYKAELSYLTPPSYSGESVGKSMEWVCFWSLHRYHYTLNKHFLLLLGSNPRDTERYQYLVGTKSYLVQPVSCVEPS